MATSDGQDRAGQHSSARARELGNELRRKRELRGYSGVDMARKLHWSQSKISRMESGDRPTSEVDVAVYLASCGVTGPELDRLLQLCKDTADGVWLPDQPRPLTVHEAMAVSISSFEALLIPGLLQTEEYARTIIKASVTASPEVIEQRVADRMARQAVLRGRNAPKFAFYLDEAVIRRPVGGPAVMNEQMLKLVLASGQSHVSVRLVPFAAGAHACMTGSFAMLEYAQHRPVVYFEHEARGVFVERRPETELYQLILTRLAETALNEGQSREVLAQLASKYDQPREDRNDHA